MLKKFIDESSAAGRNTWSINQTYLFVIDDNHTTLDLTSRRIRRSLNIPENHIVLCPLVSDAEKLMRSLTRDALNIVCLDGKMPGYENAGKHLIPLIPADALGSTIIAFNSAEADLSKEMDAALKNRQPEHSPLFTFHMNKVFAVFKENLPAIASYIKD
jgi:hypothetical protein